MLALLLMVHGKRFRTIFSDVEARLGVYIRSQGMMYFTMVMSSFLALGVTGVLYILLSVVFVQITKAKAPAYIAVTTDTRRR